MWSHLLLVILFTEVHCPLSSSGFNDQLVRVKKKKRKKKVVLNTQLLENKKFSSFSQDIL